MKTITRQQADDLLKNVMITLADKRNALLVREGYCKNGFHFAMMDDGTDGIVLIILKPIITAGQIKSPSTLRSCSF